MYNKYLYLTCIMLLHYLVKFKNPNCYGIFTLNVIIHMFN